MNHASIQTIIDQLREQLPILRQRYQVRSLGIFGSHVRQEPRVDSDLDLLVTFDDPPSLLGFIKLEHELSELLGVQVDLVMRDALKPTIGQRILNEVMFV